MSRRKRRAVGPSLSGADLDAAVAGIALQFPGHVFLVTDKPDGVVRQWELGVGRPPTPRFRHGRYGDLDDHQVLQEWAAATTRLKAAGRTVTPLARANEMGRDRSTIYRWAKRFHLPLYD